MQRPSLSVIIPAYNEENRLGGTLQKIAAFVESRSWPIELIIVNNNSGDRTGEIASEFCAAHPWARTLQEPIQGKGAAVRIGMLAGKGDYLFMCDADLSMPIEELERFYAPPIFPHDIAIASRELPASKRVDEPQFRHVLGRFFNYLVRVLAVPGIKDTQCGFKSFSRAVAQTLFGMQTVTGWAFDVEILSLARKRGFSILEVPITWYYQSESKVQPGTDSVRMLVEVVRIRLNHFLGRYRRKAS